MFTRNIKDTFTQGLLNVVSGVLGEAKKKCSEECKCEACMKEGYMPTNDAPSDKDRKTAGKLGALLKREREAKEKKEPNGVKTEETEVDENYISHAQRKAVWANRADDGKGHPDKKKKMKESNDDVPFEGPYDKPGVRKDKYGNIIKNVAKHLAKKAMKAQKNEEVSLDEENDEGWYTHSQLYGSKKSEKHPKGISAAEWKSGIRWHHGKNKRINIKEEVELDENAKVAAHLIKRYGENVRQSHVRSAAGDLGVDASKLSKAVRKKLGKKMLPEAKEKTEYDYEGDMAMGQLKSIIANSQRMHDMLSDDTNLPEWVQSKITLAEDYISTASNYMQGEMSEETVNEYAALAGAAGRMIASKLAKNAGAGVATRAMAGAAGSTAAKSAVKKFSSTKETNEETIEEKRGLWDNIHAKRKRIKGGSGERMRKPGSEGAPSAADLKAAQTEEVQIDELSIGTMKSYGDKRARTAFSGGRKPGQSVDAGIKMKSKQSNSLSLARTKINRARDTGSTVLNKEEIEQVDEISKAMAGRYINKAKDSIDMTSYRSGIKAGTAISSSTPYNPKNPLEKKLTKRHKGISMAVKKLTKEDIEAVKSMHESYKNTFNAALEHYNIKSPSELGEDKRKEFFNHVDQKFKKGDN